MLPTGANFYKPSGLKEILMKKKEAYLRSITEDMLACALERGIRPGDTAAINAIVAATGKDGYRTQPWLTDITRTCAFRHRRNADPGGL